MRIKIKSKSKIEIESKIEMRMAKRGHSRRYLLTLFPIYRKPSGANSPIELASSSVSSAWVLSFG